MAPASRAGPGLAGVGAAEVGGGCFFCCVFVLGYGVLVYMELVRRLIFNSSPNPFQAIYIHTHINQPAKSTIASASPSSYAPNTPKPTSSSRSFRSRRCPRVPFRSNKGAADSSPSPAATAVVVVVVVEARRLRWSSRTTCACATTPASAATSTTSAQRSRRGPLGRPQAAILSCVVGGCMGVGCRSIPSIDPERGVGVG